MTDRSRDTGATEPCGFGIFNGGGDLLVAFPSDAKARDVLQACEHDGYQTDNLEMRPVFTAPREDGRIAALEAQLRQAQLDLAAVTRQRDEMYGELMELRARL